MRRDAARMVVAIGLLCGVSGRPATAEILYPDVPAWTSPAGETHGVVLGDVDGDGDLDLVRASFLSPTTLTLNHGGTLAGAAAWVGPSESMRAAALGDVDGDGDLDLVLGHDTNGASLWLNTGGTFAATPAWRGGTNEPVRTLALADYDGDGDLDLFSANDGAPGSTVYRNTGGTFGASPAWTGPVASSYGLALGDVNADGRIDLVLGNQDEPATLFLNSAGGFAAAPHWTGPAEPTRRVALGDVDGDGDLDLVRGNRGAGTTLYRNEGGTFETGPIWTGPVETTYAIALGDVDGDGDLDLMRGNAGGATLSLGDGERFADAPDWIGPVEDTRSVALGDLDGDGDLDLVRGNLGQPSTLYPNVASPFPAAPAWTGVPEDTRAVAFGDVDRDGDLDLVRGNLGAVTLVRNTRGALDSLPSWTGPSENTFALALGDVDGDGDLDLVRGNYIQGSTLYRNEGGTFAAGPAWTGPPLNTDAVALGDVDGDGDLDLLCGNRDQGATLFLNEGGTFGASAAWTGPPAATWAIALGDVDGDGDLDLACGNQGEPAALFANTGGTFGATPVWTGPAEATRAIAIVDADGDGALDLVRGNAGAGSTLYLGNGGTFASAPTWVGPTEHTVSVAVGDLDGDGDLDLIRGNLDGPATVTLNHGAGFEALPAATVAIDTSWSAALADVDADGDLDAMLGSSALFLDRSPWIGRDGGVARLLPDHAGHLRRVGIVSRAPNRITLAFAAVDAESDPLTIVGAYQFRGAREWHPMEFAGGPGAAGPFAASPGGTAHMLEWNVTRIPFDRRDVVVRLRALSPARRGGPFAFVPAYLSDAGRVVPQRPSLSAAPATLVLPTVTVGDTTEATLRITNGGNLDLVIQDFATPAPEIEVLAASGLTVPPGGHRDVVVRLRPRAPLAPAGSIRLTANDPARPTLDIAVATDVRELAFETRLLAVAPELPLGEAATVVVTPAPQVRIESGWVFHRAAGAVAFADSSPLVRQGANFIALVPSQGVTEAGLEYWVRVENSGVTRSDPPAAPAQVHFHPVAPPAAVIAAASPDDRGAFPQGRATPVVATLPAGSEFVEGAIHWRAGGAVAEDSVALELREVSPGVVRPVATIPGEAVGPRGLEIRARVRTRTRTLTDPPAAGGARRTVRVTVDHLVEPGLHAARRYRLVTVPLELDLPTGASLEALLSDQAEFGPPDATRWRGFRYGGPAGGYLEVGPASSDPRLRPEPGRGFWLVAAQPNAIDTAPVSGRSTPTAGAFEIPLEPGWNQIGHPFLFPVAWSGVAAEDASGPVSLEPPVGWDEALQRYADADVGTLEPFTGYWVWNPAAGPAVLRVPPVEAPEPLERAAAPAARAAERAGDAWMLRIEASAGPHADTRNGAGVDPRARDGRDPLDRTEPPAAPAGLSLAFLDPAGADRTPRALDLRAAIACEGDPADRGRRWVFDVARSGDDAASRDAQLVFHGIESVPPELELRLVDRVLGRVVDLRRERVHSFVSTRRAPVTRADEARFELLAGTAAWVAAGGRAEIPAATRLLPGFPNPMASSATIRFELARAGAVRLEAFDVAGRRVRGLLDAERDAGVHELSWSGDDENGVALAPGVYVLRLVAPGHDERRRLVKVR